MFLLGHEKTACQYHFCNIYTPENVRTLLHVEISDMQLLIFFVGNNLFNFGTSMYHIFPWHPLVQNTWRILPKSLRLSYLAIVKFFFSLPSYGISPCGWTRLSGDGSLRHLAQPCCVALGRALICIFVVLVREGLDVW